jgi:uncharacterized membrane protein YphA (DoxX/SURF4 family)
VLRLVVASVWLHQGTWTKLLGPEGRHHEIVAAVPGLGPVAARRATRALGAGETALALWVLSGHRPRRAAAVQTGALVAMNLGGLAFARGAIPQRRRMLARNAVFLAGVWTAR